MQVAVVGLGIMGTAMARKLLSAGHTVVLNNRTREKAQTLIDAGAGWADTPGAAARGADVAITSVTDQSVVSELALGPDGILESLAADSVYCDMSTVSPVSAGVIARTFADRGRRFAQCPVLGSKGQIENGALLVFGGGQAEDVARGEEAWSAFSQKTWHFETAEEAAAAKLACNALIGHMIVGLGQSLLLGARYGVDPTTLLEILDSSAMGNAMFRSKGASIVKREFGPNFVVRNMLKDLALVSDAARSVELPLPTHGVTRELFVAALRQGYGDQDYSAVVKVLEQLAGEDL